MNRHQKSDLVTAIFIGAVSFKLLGYIRPKRIINLDRLKNASDILKNEKGFSIENLVKMAVNENISIEAND